MNQSIQENFKHIHIGQYLKIKVEELKISQTRICNFLNILEEEIEIMYQSESIDSQQLLRWSKLLEYDFFRLYSQHLVFYSPPSKQGLCITENNQKSRLPVFKKNIYTREIINFILDLINSQQKTKQQVINEYRIPKTTLYKWISKNTMYEKP
jgi:hypothetical protein